MYDNHKIYSISSIEDLNKNWNEICKDLVLFDYFTIHAISNNKVIEDLIETFKFSENELFLILETVLKFDKFELSFYKV